MDWVLRQVMQVRVARRAGSPRRPDMAAAGWCLLSIGLVMTGLGILGLRPADPEVLESGGGHHDAAIVVCWLAAGSIESLLGGALVRRASKPGPDLASAGRRRRPALAFGHSASRAPRTGREPPQTAPSTHRRYPLARDGGWGEAGRDPG